MRNVWPFCTFHWLFIAILLSHVCIETKCSRRFGGAIGLLLFMVFFLLHEYLLRVQATFHIEHCKVPS